MYIITIFSAQLGSHRLKRSAVSFSSFSKTSNYIL